MTTQKSEREKLAEEHGKRKAQPIIRSMWPQESRGVMALHFQRSFEAGYDARDAEVEKLKRQLEVALDGLKNACHGDFCHGSCPTDEALQEIGGEE